MCLAPTPMTIRLNGERQELPGPLTVTELLSRLHIDSRRVAVELNLVVLKRTLFDSTTVQDGDQVEIVNFVGGGGLPAVPRRLLRGERRRVS